MKTRIKKEINRYDLQERYTPQYKNWLWFWCDFSFKIWPGMWSRSHTFYTIDEAKDFINVTRAKQCTSTSYIDY